jgi:hypothetical protein
MDSLSIIDSLLSCSAILRGERALFADYYAYTEGRGELFPDLMATLRLERPLFANLRATIDRWIEELKASLSAKKPMVSEESTNEPTEDDLDIDADDDFTDYNSI